MNKYQRRYLYFFFLLAAILIMMAFDAIEREKVVLGTVLLTIVIFSVLVVSTGIARHGWLKRE